MAEYDPTKDVIVNEQNFEVLVAKLIPTSQYFERSFLMLQKQIDTLTQGQEKLEAGLDQRFEMVSNRFEQSDQRMDRLRDGQKELKADFDKRFEQVDNRFEQVNVKLDTIINRLDVKIDAGLRENRSMSIRLFSFAMVFSAISMAGLLAKMTGLF